MRKVLIAATLLCVLTACAAPVLATVYLPPTPHPRFNAQAVWANGKLHWYGGYATTVTNPITGYTYDNNRQSGYSIYNPATNSWLSSKWSDDPQSPSGIDVNLDGTIAHSEGCYVGTSQSFAYDKDGDGVKELWLHAGYPIWDGNFFYYNPVTNLWAKSSNFSGFGEGGNKAQYLGVAALWEKSSTEAYAYCIGGGFWGPDAKSVAKYDMVADTWTELADAPTPLQNGFGATINGKIYIAGGTQNSVAYSTGIWAFDCATETWIGKVADLLTGVERPAGAAYNGKLYIIGGQASTGDYTGIQVFDPATNTVSVLGDLPIGMSRHGATIDPATGDIYAGAGRQGGAYPTNEPWWKANVNTTPLVWASIPDDPAYFPYTNWEAGGEALSGTVTGPDGKPMGLAVVCVKKQSRGAKATADAQYYAITDGAGKYSVAVSPGDYNIAAWRMRYAPTPDQAFSMAAAPQSFDLQITDVAGANIAPGSAIYYSDQTTGELAASAIDDDLATRWSTSGGMGADQYYIIDLGSTKDVTGFTIWWEDARPGAYSVSTTTDDPNPSGSATWTQVYNCPKGGDGCDFGYSRHMEAIGFSGSVRGVKIHTTAFSQWWQGNQSAWEFIVHGTDPGPAPFDTIADVKGKADGTVVQLQELVAASGAGAVENSEIFPNTFWVEAPDRTMGLRCEYTSAYAWPGEYAQVTGTMATDLVTGERYVEATDVQSYFYLAQTPAPVAMANRALTETKLPLGLTVKTWGTVTESNSAENYFKMSDGSAEPVKVIRSGALPAVGSFATVTGALSADAGTTGNAGVIYEWTYDGYVRDWLLHGGYSVADPDPSAPIGDAGDTTAKWYTWQQLNLDQDFLASVGGQANIQPLPGDTGPNGGKWFIWSLKPWDWSIDLTKPGWTVPTGLNTIYASVWVLADKAYHGSDGLEIWIGSDDGFQIWVNGVTDASMSTNIWRTSSRDQDKIAALGWEGDLFSLNQGWNHILVKVCNVTGGFSVGMRLMVDGPSGAKVPLNLPYSVQPY